MKTNERTARHWREMTTGRTARNRRVMTTVRSRWRSSLAGVFVLVAYATAADAQQWTGIVRDFDSGAPISGAIVRVRATGEPTFTDASGRFAVDATAEYQRVVAGAVGYYSEGLDASSATELEFALEPLVYDAEQPIAFVAPTDCVGCHPVQHEQWSRSRMANAGRNRWVYDLYNGTGTDGGMGGFVYTRDAEHAEENPSGSCGACHAPERWAESPYAELPAWGNFGEAEERGVSCLVCHAVANVDTSRANFPGVYDGVVRYHRGTLVRFGALGDVDFHAPGRMRASYQPQLTADLCAACHQDSADPHGTGAYDGVVSEPTWNEWKSSPYGDASSPQWATCVDCHTSPLDLPSASIIGDPYERAFGELRSHDFHGTLDRVLEDAVALDLDVDAEGGVLEVRARVTNRGAGHHVPTGVGIRNMILLVEATSPSGPLPLLEGPRVDPLGGVGDPAQGYFAGLPGRLYGRVHEAEDGKFPVLFTESARIRFDNRIPALAHDDTVYRFELPKGATATVSARVIYRRAWRSLVDEKNWTVDGHDAPLADLIAPNFGHVMASASASYPPPTSSKGRGCSSSEAPAALVGALAVGILCVVRRRRDASRA